MDDGQRRLLGHAFAWGTTALMYWLVVRPILEMAALDFELVIVNQYELDAASLDAIPYGRAVVRWGPLPLILAGVLHTAYRAQTRWTSVLGPLALTSTKARVAVGLLVGLPFLVSIVPLAVALAVLVAVEVFTWVEWHLDVDPAVEWAFAIVPTVAVPCLLWAAWRTVRSFRDKPLRVTPARGPVQMTLRFLGALPGVVLLIASIGLALATVPQASRVVGTDGGATFAEHCGQCHFRTAPLSYSKTPFEWGLTVERMRVKMPGVISDGERERIHDFLINVRSTSEAYRPDKRAYPARSSGRAGGSRRRSGARRGLESSRPSAAVVVVGDIPLRSARARRDEGIDEALAEQRVLVDVQVPTHRRETRQAGDVRQDGVVGDQQVPTHRGEVRQAGDVRQDGVVVDAQAQVHRREVRQAGDVRQGGVGGDVQVSAHRREVR